MQKRLRAVLLLMLFTLLLAVGWAWTDQASAAGDASDPLISLSYLTGTFIPSLKKDASAAAEAAVQKALPAALQRLQSLADTAQIPSIPSVSGGEVTVDNAFLAKVRSAILSKQGTVGSSAGVLLHLQTGERLRIGVGAEFLLRGGAAALDGARAAEFSDVTTGSGGYAGIAVSPGNRYVLATDDPAGLVMRSAGDVYVLGSYQVVPVYQVSHTDTADILSGLGLFRGTGKGYALEREATRLEALVMFLRLLGEEEEALSYTGTHPFTDVPYWAGDTANKYVAYAYAKGYAAGVSATRFGASDPVTLEQYLTFLLRALGYSSSSDFNWIRSPEMAVRVGLINETERKSFLRTGFYRDGVAYCSYRALFSYEKNGGTMLSRLVLKGALTSEQATQASQTRPVLIGQ